jgi:hypothetical protein
MKPPITAPELMPVLSRGKHRNLRRGACFMEMASFLAGERWSDHPACTHPLLAELARLVNDGVTDRLRPALIPLIPSVIGLASDDLHVDVTIALRSALAALPIAAEPRQRVLATAVIRCESVLAELDGRDQDSLTPHSRQVLDQVPDAAAWARSFSSGSSVPRRTFRAKIAPRIVNIAVESLVLACARDVEQQLVDLLEATIADCQRLILPEATSKLSEAEHPCSEQEHAMNVIPRLSAETLSTTTPRDARSRPSSGCDARLKSGRVERGLQVPGWPGSRVEFLRGVAVEPVHIELVVCG